VLRRIFTSIAAQVSAVVLGAFIVLALLTLSILQGPFSAWVYPRTIADNAAGLEDLARLVEQSDPVGAELILNAYESQERLARISPEFADHLDADVALEGAFFQRATQDITANPPVRDLRFASLRPSDLGAMREDLDPRLFGAAYALHIGIGLEDGRVLNVWLAPSVSLDRRPAAMAALAFIGVFFAISLSAAVAFIVHRPIGRLERDAGQVVLADAGGSVTEEGPVELRQLAVALNQMRRRLAGLISEREQIIAAIAHDVRTGLTRVRLRLDEDQTVTAQELESDLSQMEHLVSDMVAYARAESPSGHRELMRMNRFLDTLATNAPTPVTFKTALCDDDEFVIAGDPVALRRLFENLLENARRYGAGEVSLSVTFDQGDLVAKVEDNGPGLAEDQLEAVFKPFHRVETSRNRATGGSGLGLGIARSIALAHGAAITLRNRPQGGLSAVVRFPADTRT
jgi:signal transduction histidine kinase